jgi:hypothetical protein
MFHALKVANIVELNSTILVASHCGVPKFQRPILSRQTRSNATLTLDYSLKFKILH